MGERARHVMPSSPRRRVAFSQILRGGLAVVTAVVLGVTGFGWWTLHGMLSGITVSQALGATAPKPAGAAINILLIGLDSRKDQNGNDLPAGDRWTSCTRADSTSGGYNTNTLILVHLAEDGGKVEAFSIPAGRLRERLRRRTGLRAHQDQGGLRADQGRQGAEARRGGR